MKSELGNISKQKQLLDSYQNSQNLRTIILNNFDFLTKINSTFHRIIPQKTDIGVFFLLN